MNLKRPIPFVWMALFALTGCKKSGTPAPTPKKNVDVYVGGNIKVSGGYVIAAYWKNGVAVKVLDTLTQSWTEAIAVNGKDVYLAGYIVSPTGNIVATYWKNGIATMLEDDTSNSYASAITISGNDVYIAGDINYDPIHEYTASDTIINKNIGNVTLWKNQVPLTLFNGLASAIIVNGDNIYVAGQLVSEAGTGYIEKVCYWNNGSTIILKGGTYNGIGGNVAIAVKDTDVYVAGAIIGPSGNTVINYWKNGVSEILSGFQIAEVNAITINNTDVYIAGFTGNYSSGNTATYWRNGNPTALLINGSTSSYQSTAIALYGTDVYISGGPIPSGYWKNGAFTQFPNCVNAAGIVVVPN